MILNSHIIYTGESLLGSRAEVAFQLERKLDTSIAVVNHPDDFAEEIRATLRPILTTSMNELLLELALVDEAASRLSVRCYTHIRR